MDEINIRLESYSDGANVLKYNIVSVQISNPSLRIDRLGSNLCSRLISVIDGPLERYAESFLAGAELETAIIETVGPRVAALRTEIPGYAGYELEQDNDVVGEVTYSGGIEQLYSTTEGIYTALQALFGARLFLSGHRMGMSYTSTESTKSLPQPNENSLVNFHVSLDGINSILENVWYLMWSTVARDPEAYDSSLCKPLETDPCPFPPVIHQVSSFSLEYAALVSAFATNFEAYTSFTLEAVVPSPVLDVRDGLLSGSAMAGIVVKGKRLFRGEKVLANLEGVISLDATTPVYNDRTGSLSGLLISDVEIEDITTDISSNVLLDRTARIVANVARRLLNRVIDSFLDIANEGVDKALQGVVLKIPSLENFPNPGEMTNFYLSDASVEVIGSTEQTTGFFDLDSNFTVEVV